MSRVYYYMVHVSPAAGGTKYFIAISKRQIKKYCRDNHLNFDTIFDPDRKPTEGIHYTDISNYPVN